MESKTESKTRLFEQQPKESNKAFAAFSLYLNMGPQRSLDAVARQLAKSLPLIKRWSARWQWTARVAAHAAHLAEQERLAIQGLALGKAVEWERKHESVRREAWHEAEKTIAMLREARKRWEESGRIPGFEGMARMMELAFRLKQFATGMPSEVKEVRETHSTNLRVEWEVALRKVYGVAAPPAKEEGRLQSAEVVDVEEVKADCRMENAEVEDGESRK
jgi:hypothetical protein